MFIKVKITVRGDCVKGTRMNKQVNITSSETEKVQRLIELDGLRGVLAWWVLIGHVAYSFDDLFGDLSLNNFAVHVFIILSGFVITQLLSVKKEPYLVFITRRWFRIFPVFFVLLCLSSLSLNQQLEGGAGGLFYNYSPYQQWREDVLAYSQVHFWPHFTAHLTLLHGVLPSWMLVEADSTLLAQAWSLSVEWQYYLMAPFIVWAASSSKRWGWLVGFVMVMTGLRMIDGYKYVGGFFPSVMYYFLCGILSYYAWREKDDPVIRRFLPWFVAGFALDQLLRYEFGGFIWCLVFATIADLGPKVLTSFVRKVLTSPALQYLGKQSYPLYIGHLPLHMLVLYALMPLRSMPYVWGTLVVSLTFVGSLLLAALLHKYVETPGMELGRWLSSKIKAA